MSCWRITQVVYLLIPTSNHNLSMSMHRHTLLFISWFLHQTTTQIFHHRLGISCLSLDSYIKPQPQEDSVRCFCVVYLLIPTSNHNPKCIHQIRGVVVYLLIPTSNHNTPRTVARGCVVVYLLIPTSNHNRRHLASRATPLFISRFLHQTTTLVEDGCRKV